MLNKSGRPILACITAQSACQKIIRTGLDMARHLDTALQVVTVQPKKMEAEQRAEDVYKRQGRWWPSAETVPSRCSLWNWPPFAARGWI